MTLQDLPDGVRELAVVYWNNRHEARRREAAAETNRLRLMELGYDPEAAYDAADKAKNPERRPTD